MKVPRKRFAIVACQVYRRFWRNVPVRPNEGCWDWKGLRNVHKYGTFTIFSCAFLAHRLAYELEIGVVPNHLCVLHRCDNPSCVRPEHLFLGTLADNNNDRTAKGRNRLKSSYIRPTHCLRGHEFTAENTWYEKTGARHCRICNALRQQRYREEGKVGTK